MNVLNLNQKLVSNYSKGVTKQNKKSKEQRRIGF